MKRQVPSNIGYCRCAFRSMKLGYGSATAARCRAHGRPSRYAYRGLDSRPTMIHKLNHISPIPCEAIWFKRSILMATILVSLTACQRSSENSSTTNTGGSSTQNQAAKQGQGVSLRQIAINFAHGIRGGESCRFIEIVKSGEMLSANVDVVLYEDGSHMLSNSDELVHLWAGAFGYGFKINRNYSGPYAAALGMNG